MDGINPSEGRKTWDEVSQLEQWDKVKGMDSFILCLFFYSGPQHIGWCWPTLGQGAIYCIEPSDSNANLIHKPLQTHPEIMGVAPSVVIILSITPSLWSFMHMTHTSIVCHRTLSWSCWGYKNHTHSPIPGSWVTILETREVFSGVLV